MAKQRETVKDLWMRYHEVCQEAKANGRYDRVEGLAYARLQQELRKLKQREKAAA